MVAVSRSILVIVWHLLADSDIRYTDLGSDHYARHVNTESKKRTYIRQLESLGYRVTIEPAALTPRNALSGSAGCFRLPG